MNKKLMALAVAAAVSAPALALADDSTVTVYGTLNVDIESVEASGASDIRNAAGAVTTPGSALEVKSRTRVSSNSSNIGFRGSEPLGGGLNAWFQIENSVPVDAGGGTWASRNSGVGLNGGFGTILLGQWDSPYKFSTTRLDPFGDTTIAGYTGIMGGGGNSTGGNAGSNFIARSNFDRRVSNTAQYWTPNWSGFSGRLGYGANEEKPANGSTNPTLWDVSLGYENGPLYLAASYEEHKDFGTIEAALPIYLGPNSINPGVALPALSATPKGKDDAQKYAASYTFFNALTLSGIYEKLKYKSDDLGISASVDNWYVAGTYAGGPHRFSLTYASRGKTKLTGAPGGVGDVQDSEARQYAARYGYSFSKRTEFYVLYTRIQNDANAFQDFTVNPIGFSPSGATATRGADPQGFGAGFIHKF